MRIKAWPGVGVGANIIVVFFGSGRCPGHPNLVRDVCSDLKQHRKQQLSEVELTKDAQSEGDKGSYVRPSLAGLVFCTLNSGAARAVDDSSTTVPPHPGCATTGSNPSSRQG